jgi:hypothetical protein
VGKPLEPPYEGKALKSEPQECFRDEISSGRKSWKLWPRGRGGTADVAGSLGDGTPGYVADFFSGAEEEPKTQERRLPRRGAQRGESNTLEEVERHERMFRLIASVGIGVTKEHCGA